MEIDFEAMKVGDSVKLPGIKWKVDKINEQFDRVQEYVRSKAGEPQFTAEGDEKTGYTLTRVR